MPINELYYKYKAQTELLQKSRDTIMRMLKAKMYKGLDKTKKLDELKCLNNKIEFNISKMEDLLKPCQ